jgi:hypothetical protein
VIRPDLDVELEGEVVARIDFEPLFASADAASRSEHPLLSAPTNRSAWLRQ